MLASLLVTLALLFFVGAELTLYSILISLAVPGIVSPIATIILLHVNHQLELGPAVPTGAHGKISLDW